MTLILDIETVPQEAAMGAPYPAAERNPPANYKSEEAIGKWRIKDESDWADARAKECSLTPRLGRVLCVGWKESGKPSMSATARTEAEERGLLDTFWEKVAHGENFVHSVVTWNGSWDLRFLLLRSIMLGVTPSIRSSTIKGWFRKYSFTDGHFDCKAALTNWEPRSTEGLDEWARSLGLTGKTDGMRGADVYPLYLAGHYEEIAAYCEQDVEATAAVYEKIAPYFI